MRILQITFELCDGNIFALSLKNAFLAELMHVFKI